MCLAIRGFVCCLLPQAIHNNQLVGNLSSDNTVTEPGQTDDSAAAAAAVGGGLSRVLCRLRNTVRFLKIGGNRSDSALSDSAVGPRHP